MLLKFEGLEGKNIAKNKRNNNNKTEKTFSQKADPSFGAFSYSYNNTVEDNTTVF